jgi:hypothetical protein
MKFKAESAEEWAEKLKVWHRKFIFYQVINGHHVFIQYVQRRATKVSWDEWGPLINWEYEL